MIKQILITGSLGPKAATEALAWLARSIAEIQPDEIVCTEASTAMLDLLQESYDGPIGVHAGDTDPCHSVNQLPEVYEIAPGWISALGHGQI